jgi:uncharacterized membrane protein YbhN (UPF0104 family)
VAWGGWVLFGHLQFRRLGDILAQASAGPLLLAASLNFVNIGCKAGAWRVLLGAAHPVPLWRLWRYAVASSAISVLAPLRAGEAVRILWLKEREAVPVATSLVVAASEKAFEVIALFVLLAPLPWWLPGLPPWVSRGVKLGCLGCGVGTLLMMWAIRRAPAQSASPFFQAVTAMGRASGQQHVKVFFLLLAAWFTDMGMVALSLKTVGISLPFCATLFILLTLNLAIAVPTTPGHFGPLEMGAVLALQLLGVEEHAGLAFALVYHGVQVFPLLVAALINWLAWWRWPMALKPAR